MANKKVIIDNTDVSNCNFYGETMHPTKNCTMDGEYLHSCQGYNCHYKKAEYYRQALKDIEEITATPPYDTRLGKIIMRLAEVEY